MIKFGIVGALGRMGRAIVELSLKDEAFTFSKAFEYETHPDIGKSYAQATNITLADIKIETLTIESCAGLDGIIDFSSPESTVKSSELCKKNNIPLVIGTTGFTKEQQVAIKELSQSFPVLMATNMSLGVNLLFALTRAAARTLKDKGFDPEITETHHRLKKDSPSGTAATLTDIILDELDWPDSVVTHGRDGLVGVRPEKELGVFSLRGGDVVGVHDVNFFGTGEKITLSHQATSRNTFAQGALFALKFLQKQGMGLYDMQDALKLFF